MKFFSSMSISEKREKLMELVEVRSNTTSRRRKRKREKPLNFGKEESHSNRIIKRKKLFAHVYKNMFRNAREKVKVLKQVNDIIANETCSGSKCNKQRVVIDLEGGCFGNQESANKPSRIISIDEPVDIQSGLEDFCSVCKTGGELLLCSGRGCKKRYHPSCLDPPLTCTPPGSWHCGSCMEIKNKFDVHSQLSEFHFEVSTEISNHVLPYVNKLRDYWHRGHNAVIFDGKDRLLKVVFFVLSLLDNVSQPILIIAATSVLSLWEAEFLKWSNVVKVVTFKGNKDDRVAIRASGFYSEDGSKTFQVLLSSPEAINENSKMLDHIKWELLVMDECQRYSMTRYSKKIKMLVAETKLLTVTDEAVDIIQRYRYILSLLDSKCEDIYTDTDMETNVDDTEALKERLLPFIAYEFKLSTTEIKEYWVPAHLSSMQIDQYCSILNSSFETLSTSSKDISSIHDILTNIHKCCDHPYLVDPTLRKSFKRDDTVDPLGAEIAVSGKLQVLDKLLLEVKQCGLRAVVLFRSVQSSGNVSIGDILDDLVYQRFGQDSYVRIGKVLSKPARRKRKETLNMFNCVDNRKFVCLFDSKACHSSIQLSRVDVVILFNSGWNPSSDIRALHKITDDKNREQLKVIRLYSAFTVEEKALIFSKQGAPLDIFLQHINWTTCHQLLSWGTSYLFKEPALESSFMDDLFHELSCLLRNTSGKTGPTNHSIISKADLRNGSYSNSILLLGETEAHTKESSSIEEDLVENGFSPFWTNLLKERYKKRQKFSANRSSRKVQKSPQNTCYLFEGFEADKGHPSIKRKARSKRKTNKKSGLSPWAGVRLHSGGRQSSDIPPNLSQDDIRREAKLPTSPPTSISEPLEAEKERIRKEQEQADKLHQEKKSMLLAECEKEISEIRKKYDMLITESETCVTKERRVREDYQALVDANKLLAQQSSKNLDLNTTEDETSSFKVHHIPASTLIRPTNSCSTNVLITHLSSQSLGGSEIQAPAPHLRLNPLLFPFFRSRPTTLDQFLDPLLTQLSPQNSPIHKQN